MQISNLDQLRQHIFSQLSAKLAEIQSVDRRPRAILLGLSGGLDSTVLLHLLASLKGQLDNVLISAVHINHGVHEDSDLWAEFCQDYCRRLYIPLYISRHDLAQVKTNREAVFRQTRYQVFADQLPTSGLLLTAHHQHDQSETILFNLFRGAGIRGLRAMKPCVSFASGFHLRPLLSVPNNLLNDYAQNHALKWIDDPSNTDTEFDRNYIRHKVIPVIAKRWPVAPGSIARSGENLLETEEIVNEVGLQDIKFCKESVYPGVIENTYMGVLNLERLQQLSRPRRRNLIRLWLIINAEFTPSSTQLIQIDERLCTDSQAGLFEYQGYQLRVYKKRLYLMQSLPEPASTIAIRATQGNEYVVESLSLCIHITYPLTPRGNENQITPADIELSFFSRQGGEKINRNGQTQELKTIYQDCSVPPWERDLIPLIYKDNQLVAVPGVALADNCPFKQTSLRKYTPHIT